jgi:hypothetical protein
MTKILLVCARHSFLLRLTEISNIDVPVERFLGTAFSLDEDLGGIVAGIKNERDDIERLRGMIDGQREYAPKKNTNQGKQEILNVILHRQ